MVQFDDDFEHLTIT